MTSITTVGNAPRATSNQHGAWSSTLLSFFMSCAISSGRSYWTQVPQPVQRSKELAAAGAYCAPYATVMSTTHKD
eukprot:3347293-Amphidinium_carterae.1